MDKSIEQNTQHPPLASVHAHKYIEMLSAAHRYTSHGQKRLLWVRHQVEAVYVTQVGKMKPSGSHTERKSQIFGA